jgi:hypothetical protein
MAWVRVRDKQTGKISVKSEGVAKSLKDKFEIISSNVEQVDEFVTDEVKEEIPNSQPAANEVAVVDEVGVDLANARKEYEELYGEKPHGRLKLESLVKLINEKKNAG